MRDNGVIIEALDVLLRRSGTESDLIGYLEQTIEGFGGSGVGAGRHRTDRGAAILMAANLEYHLQIAIERKLSENERDILFDDDTTFAKKIQMGRNLGLFGPQTNQSLTIIRKIRNVFAHARVPVSFATPEINDACAILVLPAAPETSVKSENDEAITGRARYKLVCDRIGVGLLRLR